MSTRPALSDAKRQLLEKLMRGEAREQAPPVPAVVPRQPGIVVPLSAGQRQIWLHAAMSSDAPLYNEAATIHRFGSFDLAAMRTAINELLRRHEAWRTSFDTVDGELVQIINPHRPIDIPFSDVSDLPEADRDAAATAIATHDVRQPIDLSRPPLLRAHIVKLADDNHRIYWALHHIIFDGVALYRVILPELAVIYEAFAAGRRAELPPPPLQYGDYAVWQRDFVESALVRKQLDQWRALLADAPAKLQLPTDRAVPPVRSHIGSMEVFAVPAPLADALKRFSRAEGVTLYMTLLAAFKAMLHRYTGEQDLVIGGVTDLRRRPEIEQLVGYLLNTISLRSKPSGALPFRAYLGQVRDNVLTAIGASDAPFDLVVREVKPKSDPGSQPLFNTFFSIQPQVDPFPEGWDLTQMDVVTGASKFDLYLELDERPDGIDGRFIYSTELFEPATIRRMIGHWLTLLGGVVADPDCPLSDLPLLTAEESERMLGDWNDTSRALPAESLPQLIAAQARSDPDKIALESGAERWSYTELDREAGRIASRLHAAGVKPGAVVAVLMNRSPRTVAGLLAILRLGAAYLPLDPNFPAARLDHILADAAPDTLLTEAALAKMMSPANCRIVLAEGAAEGEPPPIPQIAGEDLAYVLYTSGSTGKPKGAEISHDALLNLLLAMADAPGFTANDSMLAVSTFSFDIATLEMFLPLLRGGRIILASREDALDPERIADLIADKRPSVMQATPATWRALVESGWKGAPQLKIMTGGDALSRDLADKLLDRCGELWNLYGPTETTIYSTGGKVERGIGPVPIGRPIANTTLYLLDAGGQQVPVGVVGELYIGGTGVARGYRGRADLTAERFGEKPVAPGDRLYRSGDLARYAEDGTLYCLGRTDNDEKIRGFRIAVEEVEGALNSHPAIAAAAVRSWPDGSGNRYLAAYLVGHDGTIPSVAALRDHLASVLPDYMIPARFEHLLELPMTPNRKVDRKALPEPGEGAMRQDFVPPQGPAEERLAAIWREVLGIDAVGHSDSFFDLGGHSLLVTKLLRKVEADYGRKFAMADFFQSYRLDQMAARLEQGGEQATAVPMVTPRPANATIPLSANQRQVWLHESMTSGALLYNESITIHRHGAFDRVAMTAAFNEILRRHESWRTGFEMIDGELIQTVQPWRAIELPFTDLTGRPAHERHAGAEAIGGADARAAFDLTRPPLYRAHIVRLAEDDHRLYLTLHHIIFDGLTLNRVILPELSALYEAYAAGKPSPLPEPVLQYGDYAIWQRDHLESAAVEQQLDHWRDALAAPPPKLALPGDHARPVERTHAGAMEVFTVPADLAAGLKALSRDEGVTLYMLLLAAFKAMLHRYSGEQDIVVGGVTDLRRRAEIEPLAGYFLNTIALRSKPSGDQPFRSYLAQVRDSVLGALGASDVPFDMIVRALKLRAEPGEHPLFDIFFSMQPFVDPYPAGWDLTHSDIAVGAAKFDLYLEIEDRPGAMIGRLPYSSEIFEPATIRRMIGHWLTILADIVADPDRRLADLSLLTVDETQRMLVAWNDTARPLPAESLPQLIAAEARLHPAAVALVSGETRWSYADLDREAGRIASRLHASGVTAGSLVGVLMNRSPQTVAGLLAILRLGAAYLPLDPGFPAARLEHIVADAAPDTLLTEPALARMLAPRDCRILLAEGPAVGEVPPSAAIDGDDLAYVLYTSGSTGKPKGVEISHRALMNLLLSMADAPGFTAVDSLLAVTTLSFDIAMLEIFLPLLRGGRLILAAREDALDPERLAALIVSTKPSVMQATPATWRALIEGGWAGDRNLKILCGGEALSRDLAEQLLTRSAELWNMYGPTETTIWSTVQKVEHGAGAIAIGRPIANTVTYVLDAGGRQAPVGVIGELYIGGAGVARGYRGRADLTAERFGEKPAAPGVRLYRTGDLARYAEDGTLYCLGRTDNDEKIRGFRIAVEEVEGALNSHPAIAAAAARSWPDASGNRYLAAYLVAQAGEIPSVGALRDHLGKILPDYMIPSRFQQLAELPMTPNRKVDRKALPEPGEAVAMIDFVPPEGEAELRLAAIWRDVLNVETIGRNDSFFDLGGHSLLVAKLLRRVEADYGRKFSMAAFFQSYRLSAMAARLEQGEPLNASGAVPIQPLGARPPILWLEAGPTFLPLARTIGLDQPFLGVSLDPMLEAAAERPDMRECARQMVALIQAFRPAGPYYIGGWCTAGVLAYEVAAQLRAAGEDVPLVLLAHATNPTEAGRFGAVKLALSKLRYHLDQLGRQPRGERWRYLRDRIQGVGAAVGLQTSDLDETALKLRAKLDRSLQDYRPPAYAGDVALFQPAERPDLFDSKPGWEPLVSGRFVAHEISGTHSSMLLEPHVEQFAKAVREELLRVQSAPGVSRNHLRAVG